MLHSFVVFLVALGYLLILRPYGFQVEDEGTLLFWFDRILLGQRPYLDFHTGYTPGFFALGSAVFHWIAPTATALRLVLAVVNAATAAGLHHLTRQMAPAWVAPLPPLLWLAFVPVYVGEFAAFNIPYPVWPVTLAWVIVAAALLRWSEASRPASASLGLLAITGLACACALWLRPNAGAFSLAGATWVVCVFAARRTTLDRFAAVAAAASMALGVWYTFQFRLWGMDAFVHLLPAAALVAMAMNPPPPWRARASSPGAFASLAVLAAAFTLPSLAWMAPLLRELGTTRFLYEVFLVGADYQTLYYVPHPSVQPYAAAVVAATLGVALIGRMVARHRVSPVVPLSALAVAGAVAAGYAATFGVAPEGLGAAIASQLENASFWFAVPAHFGAVLLLWRSRRTVLSTRTRALAVITPLAVMMYAQMFPRSDFMHQVTAVPLGMVVASMLLARVVTWWSRGQWPEPLDGGRTVRSLVLGLAAAVLAVKFAVNLAGPLAALATPAPDIAMPVRLDVHVEAKAADELDAIARTAAFLRDHTRQDESILAFPAVSGLLFAAGRTNATPHDYWFPGRPDHAEEARVLTALRAEPPRYVVTINTNWNVFAESPAYFSELRGFVRTGYRLAARHGRFDILARKDLAAASPEDVDGSSALDVTAPTSANEPPIEPDLMARRLAARRWMRSLTPQSAAAATLPENPRDALLLLRALRDGGDMRGAGWAIRGFASDNPRVRGEAVDAMAALLVSLRTERLRLAGDHDPAALRPFLESYTDEANDLARIDALYGFAQAILEITEPDAAR